MTSTLCRSAAPGRIMAPWPAKIAAFLHAIVTTILAIAEIVRTILHETMRRQARLRHHRRGFLPPSASPLHGAVGVARLRIADKRKVTLDVCLSAEMREVRQVPSPRAVPDRSREDQPAETMVPTVRESA